MASTTSVNNQGPSEPIETPLRIVVRLKPTTPAARKGKELHPWQQQQQQQVRQQHRQHQQQQQHQHHHQQQQQQQKQRRQQKRNPELLEKSSTTSTAATPAPTAATATAPATVPPASTTAAAVAVAATSVALSAVSRLRSIAESNTVLLADDDDEAQAFSFDKVLDDASWDNPQERLMDTLGSQVLADVLKGSNSCIVAFGETGSGKSHSLVGGPGDSRGLIPRVTEALLQHCTPHGISCYASYAELLDDNFRDLLLPLRGGRSYPSCSSMEESNRAVALNSPAWEKHSSPLRLEGLQQMPISSSLDVDQLLRSGAHSQAYSSVSLPGRSSRSATIFTLELRQPNEDSRPDRNLLLNFVELPGSEELLLAENWRGTRLSQTVLDICSAGDFKVISNGPPGRRRKLCDFDGSSPLQLLLKDFFTGNWRTSILTTSSPVQDNVGYRAAGIAVRFACGARQMFRNCPATNPTFFSSNIKANTPSSPNDPLLLEQERALWEEWRERQQDAMDSLGLLELAINGTDRGTNISMHPALVSLNPDPALNKLIVFALPAVPMSIGADNSCKIVVQAVDIKPISALVDWDKQHRALYLQYVDGLVHINGKRLRDRSRVRLRSGDRVVFGYCSCFMFTTNFMARTEDCCWQAAMSELCLDETPPWQDFKLLMGQFQAKRYEDLKAQAKGCAYAVEEANAINRALRLWAGMEFRVEVLMTIRDSCEEAECVVHFRQVQKAIKNSKPSSPVVLSVERFRRCLLRLCETYDHFIKAGKLPKQNDDFGLEALSGVLSLAADHEQDPLMNSERWREQSERLAELERQHQDKDRQLQKLQEQLEAALAAKSIAEDQTNRMIKAIEASEAHRLLRHQDPSGGGLLQGGQQQQQQQEKILPPPIPPLSLCLTGQENLLPEMRLGVEGLGSLEWSGVDPAGIKKQPGPLLLNRLAPAPPGPIGKRSWPLSRPPAITMHSGVISEDSPEDASSAGQLARQLLMGLQDARTTLHQHASAASTEIRSYSEQPRTITANVVVRRRVVSPPPPRFASVADGPQWEPTLTAEV